MLTAALILPLSLLPGCGGDEDEPGPTIRHLQDYLPPGTAGMVKDGSPRLATDTAGLQDIVNGGYEVYTNNGFREMIEQRYAGTVGGNSATMKIWIFDQSTRANVLALHDELLQVGIWENWGQAGEEGFERTELFAYLILFRRDEYSVRLEVGNTSQDGKDLLGLFATHIDQEMTR
jgi:hypothetical protein